jgi:hypothetical protein
MVNTKSSEGSVFIYDPEHTHEHNFRRWYNLNSQEFAEFKQPPYTLEKAKKVFNSLHGHRVSHSYKVNKQGVLEDVLCAENDEQSHNEL